MNQEMAHLIVADNGHGFLDFRELYACYNHLLHTVMNSLDLMQQNVFNKIHDILKLRLKLL